MILNFFKNEVWFYDIGKQYYEKGNLSWTISTINKKGCFIGMYEVDFNLGPDEDDTAEYDEFINI
jgi:hypothetical protein